MDRAASVTILILLLCAIAAQGVPIPGAQGRCQCIQTSSHVIRPKVIQSLKYIPRGSHCENTEIIVTLKNKKKVCVDPDAKWLQFLITAKKGGKQHN
ncbi:interleukin-8-like isoform X5 [Pristis pectinata]|uniref:interleukin-8-like isoform X2 n=1 Tax=Pristis pectinata TaxID=685728 RepID=UPI00223DF0F1|nr:interleukin-8-like isoform X2 [Pristis pectinata]XP_051893299.1 interleukin-8-like isoform X5 [Pristis pectinata]